MTCVQCVSDFRNFFFFFLRWRSSFVRGLSRATIVMRRRRTNVRASALTWHCPTRLCRFSLSVAEQSRKPCGACSEHSQCLARLCCDLRTTDLPCGGAQRKVSPLAKGKDCAPVDVSTSPIVVKRLAASKTPSHCGTEPTTSARLCVDLHDGGR